MFNQKKQVDDVVTDIIDNGYNEFIQDEDGSYHINHRKVSNRQREFVKSIGQQLKELGFQ